MEKDRNPNSHECLRQDQSSSWSKLPHDLLRSVFERLSFADSTRGKSVCSSWLSGSKQLVPKNKIPWLILFPKDKHDNSCTLFNPEEKYKRYKIQDLGAEFGKSICLATYGSWFLLRDPLYNLYILNIFTHKRINLPPVESQLGMTKINRTLDGRFIISNDHNWKKTKGIDIQSPVFWIDEKTKDYVVVWGLEYMCVVFSKKGDTSWNQIPETSRNFDMAYKDHKLYFLSLSRNGSFKIFDFSGEIPQETFQCGVVNEFAIARKLVVTVTGDVLKVEKVFTTFSGKWYYYIYKVCSSGFLKKYEADTLGDEAVFLDLGITVLANDIEGFKRNSIYLDGVHVNPANFIFNLKTKKMEPLHNFDCSSIEFSEIRWFIPCFTQT